MATKSQIDQSQSLYTMNLPDMSGADPIVSDYIKQYGLGLFTGAANLQKILDTPPTINSDILGKSVVSIGGGYASTYKLVEWAIEQRLDCVYAYCAIGNDDQTLIKKVESHFGIDILRIAPNGQPMPKTFKGFDIWHVFFAKKYLANWRVDICSETLKREAIKKYLINHQVRDIYLGITSNEVDRMIKITGNYRKINITPHAPLSLIDDYNENKSDLFNVLDYIPTAYLIGLPHNNCGNFCVKAGLAQLERAYWYDRISFELHAIRERVFNAYFKLEKYRTIFRLQKTIDGRNTSIPIALDDLLSIFRNKWRQQMFDPFDKISDQGCVYCGY